jgi:hypothetical protein
MSTSDRLMPLFREWVKAQSERRYLKPFAPDQSARRSPLSPWAGPTSTDRMESLPGIAAAPERFWAFSRVELILVPRL